MTGKVAINWLGRIGRAALKLALDQPELELVAVNEIGSIDNMAYLLRNDTVYGRYEREVEVVDGKLVIGGHPLVYLSERDPASLPWADLGLDLVFECTGRFTKREDAEGHVRAGARVSEGGDNSLENLRGVCVRCHRRRTGKQGALAKQRRAAQRKEVPSWCPRHSREKEGESSAQTQGEATDQGVRPSGRLPTSSRASGFGMDDLIQPLRCNAAESRLCVF